MRTALAVFVLVASLVVAQNPLDPPPGSDKGNKASHKHDASGQEHAQSTIPLPQIEKLKGAITAQEDGADPTKASKTHTNVDVTSVPLLSIAKDPADYILIAATATLVIIGGFQLCFLRKTIAVAKESADTAKRQVDLMIAKERARIEVDVLPVNNLSEDTFVNVVVANKGLTPAYFTEVRFGCFFSDQRGALMPEFLEPLGAGKDNTFAVSLPELSESDIERLSFRSKTLWLEGSVKYNDVFDNARETAAFFRLWCDPTGGKIPFYTWLNREKPNATNKPDKK